MDALAQAKGKFTIPPPFCPTQAPTDWMIPTELGRVSFFTQSNDSNANLFWKHLQRRTEK